MMFDINALTYTMIIPIRCFTCGKVIADKYLKYEEAIANSEKEPEVDADLQEKMYKEYNEKIKQEQIKKRVPKPADKSYFHGKTNTAKIMDDLGLTRYCCRRHMLTTVDMMHII